MKRCLVTMIAIVLASLFGPTALHAQRWYNDGTSKTNGKQMTFAQNMQTYWGVQKINLTRLCNAVPEDKFFATPPGFSKEAGIGSAEQASIGAECAHAADDMDNMCTLVLTGRNPVGVDPKSAYTGGLYGTEGVKIHTKAAVMASLAQGIALCDILIERFDDADYKKMVMSQHALQPLASTLFNTISHTREVTGRVQSYMVVFGIKEPRGINAADPTNPKDIIYCGGKEAPDDAGCTTVQGKDTLTKSFEKFDPNFKTNPAYLGK